MHHTNSRIYSCALDLIDLAKVVLDQLPQGFGFLADQLRRAAASVPLNFAEGCGKHSCRDRQRYFLAAKGSAYEVAAVLDVAARFGVVSSDIHDQGHDLCDHLGAMLSKYK